MSSGTFALQAVTFNDLHVSMIDGKGPKDIASYETKFKEKLTELRTFIKQPADSKFQELWAKTLANFAKTVLLNPTYEDRIFKEFNGHEFELRYGSLLGLYKELKTLYNSENIHQKNDKIFEPIDIAGKIQELTKQIISRQIELHRCYEGLSSKEQEKFSWEKIYNKTFKHILVDTSQRVLLVEKILSIWKRKEDPFLNLRSLVYRLSLININEDQTLFISTFKEIISSLKAIDIRSLEKIRFKELYRILCLFDFDQDQEECIFDALPKMKPIFSSAKSSKKKLPELLRVHFKRYSFHSYCKKLKAYQRADIQDEELLKRFESTIIFLGKSYSSGELEKKKWDKIYKYVAHLPLPMNKIKPILEIFPKYKKSNTSAASTGYISAAASYCYSFVNSLLHLPSTIASWKSTVGDGEATWKGDKYLKVLKGTQTWIIANEKSILEKLEDKNNPLVLKEKVEEIIEYFKKMKFPNLSLIKNPSIDDRRAYNDSLREMGKISLTKFRDALALPACDLAFARYSSLGVTSGCALVLIQLCDKRFTGIDIVTFIAEQMEDWIEIGLKKLAKEDTCYRHYCNRTVFPNPLEIDPEIIHEAIGKIPCELTSPPSHLFWAKIRNVVDINWDPHFDGAPPFPFAEIVLSGRKVQLVRFASPTNPSSGVNKEFLAFLKNKRFLLNCLLNSKGGYEARRTENLFALNSDTTTTFVTVFPVSSDSPLFNQEDEFADTTPEKSAFDTRVSFFKAIMNEIIPDEKSKVKINEPGNYLYPPCWVTEDFKKMIENCMQNTSEIFFDDAQKLTSMERRAFIKFFDVCLAFEFMKLTKAEYFAFLCNHSADRTGIFVTLMLKIILIALDKENDPIDPSQPDSYTWNQIMIAMIDGVPMIVAKREMNSFHTGLMEALKILKKDSVRQKIKENRDVFGIEDIQFPFAKNQNTSISSGKQEESSTYQSFPAPKS